MKNSIGGLFKQQTQAEQALRALQEAGFNRDDISMWMHKKSVPLNEEHRVSPLEIGLSALIGAVIASIIMAILGALILQGEPRFPGVRPDFARGSFIEMMGFVQFVIGGALAGAIVGAAIRLFTSRENARISSTGIHRGGVLLVVDASEDQKAIAEQVMKANGALDSQNLTEQWDSHVWEGFRKVQSSGSSS
jgi:hypothetical protein